MIDIRVRLALAAICCVLMVGVAGVAADIPKPDDAPQPLSPEMSAEHFHLPQGFRLEVIAAEPLIREPSGMCWDAHGRFYVCELHGYNIEGQFDIEELNKTGELDRVVRRIDANAAAKEAARQFTFGTIKLLTDSNGDGRMDQAVVFADRLPPCYGVCPARDGIIAVGAPDILFLADRDGDGKAEVREVLYTGFPTGALERGINCPQWGLDDWIYVGRGHRGGTITGPHLKDPVTLPNTDFRIKADGSAIEPVLGGTETIGFTFTERGERFVVSTPTPGIYVAPLPWRYLARNPDIATGNLQEHVGENRTYPTSQPHPWRTKRAEDPGFSKFYKQQYGIADSAPNGYFTSACSPLVYQDDVLPGLKGQLLTCEPAQNMVHRAVINRDGPGLQLGRAPGEEQSEFLSSTDPWFNPIALAHAPDGTVAIADFYREIIEDYSAIPRYLQQQYELNHGCDHGRIWRLTYKDAPPMEPVCLSKLSSDELVKQLASTKLWRRQTARRLLVESNAIDQTSKIAQIIDSTGSEAAATINALYTSEALGELKLEDILRALDSADAGVRVHALRLSEAWLNREPQAVEFVLGMANDVDQGVLLQLALTLGESRDARVLGALVLLARERGNVRWMDVAILSSLSDRAGTVLELLLADIDSLGQAKEILKPLAATIASGRNGQIISQMLERLALVKDESIRLACLQGLQSRFTTPVALPLSDAAVAALKEIAGNPDKELASSAQRLLELMRVETVAQRQLRIAGALRAITDIQLPIEQRLAAVSEVAVEDSPQVTRALLASVTNSTPRIREAILDAVFSRRDRHSDVIEALEAGTFSGAALSAVQRSTLQEHPDGELRRRTNNALAAPSAAETNALFMQYAAALKNDRDASRGEKLFKQHCGTCHQAHDVGVSVGPNLTAEANRAEEAYLQDILTPSSTISAGYVTYIITTDSGQVFTGLLASESATSVTLKQPEGKSQAILRKEIEELKTSSVSLMPDNLAKSLSPQDVADLLDWVRKRPDPTQGDGNARVEQQ